MRNPGATTPSSTTADDLLTRLQRGDERALSDLADAFGSKIYQLAFRHLRNKEDAEEVTQDVLFKVHRNIARTDRADVADWSRMADEGVLRSQLRRRIIRAILALPAIYRAPVVLRDLQGMSTEEASAMLKVKDQTLKSRLHRGRLILRKQLADFAGGLTMHRPIYGT